MMAPSNRTRSAAMLILAVALIMAAGVALSSYQRQIGLAEASPGSIAALAAVTEARNVLHASEDYAQYSAALRVAAVAHRRIVLLNAVDTDVRTDLSRALDYLGAAREAWQAEAEGEWRVDIHGSAVYWEARLGDAGFGDMPEPVDVPALKAECLAKAEAHLDSAYRAAGYGGLR